MSRTLTARALLAATIAVAVWIMALLILGGFEVPLGSFTIRSHRLLPALAIFGVCAAALGAVGRESVRDELSRWNGTLPRFAGALALASMAAALLIAVRWGTDAAGGSDSFCYLSQARLFASGAIRVEQPWVESMPWPDAARAAVPAGYTAAPGPPGTIAPMCPAGLALVMAVFFRAGGERAMLLVVPLMGALAVGLTYLAGRRVTSRGASAAAAAMFAASPIFLYQVVQPMSDVPAACLWLAALTCASGPLTRTRTALSGLSAAAAVLTRPNLLPMAAVIGAWLLNEARIEGDASTRKTRMAQTLVSYAGGLVPGMLFVAVIQQAMYGSPLRSGYASLDVLFRWDHAWPNVQRYPLWLFATQSPAVALAFLAPFARDEPGYVRRRWLLLFAALTNFACYLFYTPFDDWWYLRFLLPAIPCLLILATIAAKAALDRLTAAVRPLAAIAGVALVVLWYGHAAEARSVFRLRATEARFAETGRYLKRTLPDTAMAMTAFQSGSVRYYTGLRTLSWDTLPRESLDRGVADLSARGLSLVFVVERWEEPLFRAMFGSASTLGRLDWPPRAQIGRDVRVYDPSDRARYLNGATIATERIWIREH